MPTRPHAALLPAVQVRVSQLQRTYLLLLAERQHCSVSEAIRRVIDASIDREPSPDVEGLSDADGRPLPLRRLLEMVDHDRTEPDPAWLAAYGEGE